MNAHAHARMHAQCEEYASDTELAGSAWSIQNWNRVRAVVSGRVAAVELSRIEAYKRSFVQKTWRRTAAATAEGSCLALGSTFGWSADKIYEVWLLWRLGHLRWLV